MEKAKAELLLIFADNLRIIADNWKEKDAELYRILQCNRGEFHKYKSANRSPNLLFGLRLAHLTGIPLKELVSHRLDRHFKLQFNSTPPELPDSKTINQTFFEYAYNIATQRHITLKQLSREILLGDNYFYGIKRNIRPANLLSYIKLLMTFGI